MMAVLGIRQPLSLSPHAGGDLGIGHLWEEPPHKTGPLQGLCLAHVASEDATGGLGPTVGADRPETVPFEAVLAGHGTNVLRGTSPPGTPSLYLTDQRAPPPPT
jgi:hypothetical protein